MTDQPALDEALIARVEAMAREKEVEREARAQASSSSHYDWRYGNYLGQEATDLRALVAYARAAQTENAKIRAENAKLVRSWAADKSSVANVVELVARELRPDSPADAEGLTISAVATIARLREALQWYADPISYALTQQKEPRSAVHWDGGRRARAALTIKLAAEGV